MKHILLLGILSLSSISTFAQTSKFKFGIVFNPAWSDNLLKNDGHTPKTVEQTYKALEKRTFAYYGYCFAQYALSTRGYLLIGAGYSSFGYATATGKLIFAQPEPNAPEYAVFHYSHRDIIMPILFRYNLTKGKNHFFVTGGPTPQVKLNRTIVRTLKYADGTSATTKEDDTTTNYRKLNINGTLGFGYDLKIFHKSRLFFQPTFDCNLLGTSKYASLNRRIYSFGLNIGIVIG